MTMTMTTTPASARVGRVACGVYAALAVAGCTDDRAPITGTQSIAVELVTPTDPGDIDHRLPDGQRTITVNLTAYDADHQVDPSFQGEVQIYVQFLGTLTPSLDATYGVRSQPLSTAVMTAGKAMAKVVTLPPVYGPTTLWVDDGKNANPTHATGASPVLWFRDPYISDIQRPVDENKPAALTDSPLENKQVTVNTSRYGAVGRLVVTSVFSQGYTVSDVQCADAAGTPPCTTQAYDHVEVFSFSAPRDQSGRLIQQGQVIDGFSGGISEFNGLTEIGFPVTFATSNDANPAWLPAPVVFDKATWFKSITDPAGIINFERNEAAPIEVDNAVVCMLDDDYATFKQWKIDPAGVGGDCSNNRNVLNVITAGVVADVDPAALVGKKLSRLIGVLRPVELPTFNVWILFPRSAADLTLQ
jgi:hypothetical protein